MAGDCRRAAIPLAAHCSRVPEENTYMGQNYFGSRRGIATLWTALTYDIRVLELPAAHGPVSL